MAKRKYYYAIVEKENGNFYNDCGRLPIFWNKQVALDTMDEFNIDRNVYIVHPLSIDGMERLVLGWISNGKSLNGN